MTTIYMDVAGNGAATTNSGSTDTSSPKLSGTGNATVSGTTITLGGAPDLSGVIAGTGPNQDTIYLAQATNSNRKIFKIMSFDNTAKTVTVDVAPTGITGSNWTIGGRMILTQTNYEAMLGPGDIIQFNTSPAIQSATVVTNRGAAGDQTTGPLTIRGKAGVAGITLQSNAGAAINGANLSYGHVQNLTLRATLATAITTQTPLYVFEDCIFDGNNAANTAKIATSAVTTSTSSAIRRCEIKNINGDGIVANGDCAILSSNIHDCINGIHVNTANCGVISVDNLITNNSGRGYYADQTCTNHTCVMTHNTIGYNGNSQVEFNTTSTWMQMSNNIIVSNVAGVATVKSTNVAETVGLTHGYNLFYNLQDLNSGLVNVTAQANEIVADPLFVNAGSLNYSLQNASPAASAGYGALSATTISYPDLGAIQRKAGGAGQLIYGGG